MRWCWLIALLLFVAVGFEARAETRSPAEVPVSATEVETVVAARGGAAVSVEPVGGDDGADEAVDDEAAADLSFALDRLPPEIRPPTADSAPTLERVVSDGIGTQLVERVQVEDDRWLDVEYTIDPELEDRIRGVLDRGNVALGHVILLDPNSGEVFAYVSTDPAAFPATGTYPTASLMKVVTASAVLHKEPEAAERDCRFLGSPYRLGRDLLEPPARGGRVDTFEQAIATSNNQCFARLAVQHVGKPGLLLEMLRTGLLQPPAFGHPAGRVDPLEGPLDLGFLASGLRGSYISPLAAARLAAMLAHGELVTPYWISRVRDDEGNTVEVPERTAPRAVWSPEVADHLRELMLSVTVEGTAKRGFHDRRGRPLLGPVGVSGKTGTLRGTDPAGLYQWFIGVAPVDDPQVAIATVVVNGRRHGSSATQVSAAALRELFCEDGVCEASKSAWLGQRVRTRRAIERADAEAIAAAAAEKAALDNREQELARLFEPYELDQVPKLVGEPNIDLPRHLLRYRARGKIVVMLELDLDGEITSAEIDSSDLPMFNNFVLEQVRGWKFTPPMHEGRPVHARARLPIPIQVN